MLRTALLSSLLLPFAIAAQSSVDALGRSADSAQRLFDQRVAGTHPDTALFNVADCDRAPVPNGRLDVYASGNDGCPAADLDGCTTDKVVVSVVVERDGSLGRLSTESRCPAANAAVTCQVRQMAAWTPAMKEGRPVRCRMSFPVSMSPR